MTTPYGLLRWGQAGRYTAVDDRLVITALAGGRNGIIRPVSMAPASGLAITIEAGWLAVADCADGTCAVLASDNAIEVRVGPGGDVARRDEILAEVTDPETAQWSVSVLPPGAGAEGTGGIVLGWIHVPAGATTAEEMGLEPRLQDFSTGGAIPGPPGDRGPEGPGGPAGQSTLIVGSFGAVRTPDELPADGYIEAGWDGPDNPPNDVQLQQGWALIYVPTGHLWVFVGALTAGAPWINVGLVAGAQGPPGPEGPTGPQGPPGVGGAVHMYADLGEPIERTGTAVLALTREWVIPAAEWVPGTKFVVETQGVGEHRTAGHWTINARLDAVNNTRIADINPLVGTANGVQFGYVVRTCYLVYSPTSVLVWIEGDYGPAAPGTTAANNAAIVCSAIPVTSVAGDHLIGPMVRFATAVAGSFVRAYGSQLYVYVGDPVSLNDPQDEQDEVAQPMPARDQRRRIPNV